MILGTEGKEFIVTDGRGVYKTGKQIITSKVTTEVGEAASTEIRNLTFNDEDAIPALREIQENYPDSDIYISGNLAIDFPEDIRISATKNNYTTASLSGSRIVFSYCLIDEAIALLKEQYAVGTLEIKVVQLSSLNNI